MRTKHLKTKQITENISFTKSAIVNKHKTKSIVYSYTMYVSGGPLSDILIHLFVGVIFNFVFSSPDIYI